MLIIKFQGYVSLTGRASIQPFICEISNPSIRNVTTCLYLLFYCLGQALTVLVGSQLEQGWRESSLAMCFLLIICFLGLLFVIHETPDWLLDRMKFDEATNSLKFYKIDRKVLIDDDEKRKTLNGEEKSYEEIIVFIRQSLSPTNAIDTSNDKDDRTCW